MTSPLALGPRQVLVGLASARSGVFGARGKVDTVLDVVCHAGEPVLRMSPTETISARWLQPAHRLLIDRQDDAAEIFRTVGVDPTLPNSDRRVPVAACDVIGQKLRAELGQPDFWARSGSLSTPSSFGLLSHLVGSSPTIGAALLAFERYFPVYSNVPVVRGSVRGNRCHLDFAMDENMRGEDLHQFAMTAIHALLRHIAQEGFAAEYAYFRHAVPRNTETLEAAFGRVPSFGTATTGLAFDAEWLHVPLRTADPWLHEAMRGLADAALRQTASCGPSTSERLRFHLLRAGLKQPSLAASARALAVSARSLQRALSAEETSFRGVLERTRMQLAGELVLYSTRSFPEIAERVGLSSDVALRRAFLRTLGLTPAQARRRQRVALAAKA